MEYKENVELCHCKHVTLADIDRALAQTNRFSDVDRYFDILKDPREKYKKSQAVPPAAAAAMIRSWASSPV